MLAEQNFNLLTNNDDIKKDNNYTIIKEVIDRTIRAGIMGLGAGYCISMSDIIKTALMQRGIDSRLVECTLTLSYISEGYDVQFVGFNNTNKPGQIDTHVVVVTTTEPPILIDASIPNRLPAGCYAIIEPLVNNGDGYLLNEEYDRGLIVKATYTEKNTQHVPFLHQESIINRINSDRKIFSNLALLKILIALALSISSVNFIRGGYDFYQIYYNTSNFRGISGMTEINDRLTYLEKLLKEKNEN